MSILATSIGQASSELSLSNRTRHKKVLLYNRTKLKRRRRKVNLRSKKLQRARLLSKFAKKLVMLFLGSTG